MTTSLSLFLFLSFAVSRSFNGSENDQRQKRLLSRLPSFSPFPSHFSLCPLSFYFAVAISTCHQPVAIPHLLLSNTFSFLFPFCAFQMDDLKSWWWWWWCLRSNEKTFTRKCLAFAFTSGEVMPITIQSRTSHSLTFPSCRPLSIVSLYHQSSTSVSLQSNHFFSRIIYTISLFPFFLLSN